MASQSSDPLFSVRYSIEHAKRHISNLEVEIAAWAKSDVAAHVIEPNPDGSKDVHKFKLVKPMPVALNGMTFDALNGLRAALDQTGFAVAVASGTKGKHAHFPFGQTKVEMESRIKRRSKNIPREIFDLMTTFQPYKGGNDLLWSLNELCNTHKHEFVIPIGTCTSNIFTGMSFGAFHIGPMPGPRWDTLKNELVLFSCPKGQKHHGHIRLTMFIAFADGTPVAREPVIAVLNKLCGMVENIVATIEAEAHRLRLLM